MQVSAREVLRYVSCLLIKKGMGRTRRRARPERNKISRLHCLNHPQNESEFFVTGLGKVIRLTR